MTAPSNRPPQSLLFFIKYPTYTRTMDSPVVTDMEDTNRDVELGPTSVVDEAATSSSGSPRKAVHTGDLRRRPLSTAVAPSEGRQQQQQQQYKYVAPTSIAAGDLYGNNSRGHENQPMLLFPWQAMHMASPAGQGAATALLDDGSHDSGGGNNQHHFGRTPMVYYMNIGAGTGANPHPAATFQQFSLGGCCYIIIGWLICCPVYICLMLFILIFVGALTWEEVFDTPWDS